MNWLKVGCFTLLFSLAKSSIPQGNLPETPSFPQYFQNLVKLFKDQKTDSIKGCPYYLAKLVLTLDKYIVQQKVPNTPLSPILCRLREDYIFTSKYQPIMDELRLAFNSMTTDSRFDHISGLEFMFNKALTLSIYNNQGDVMPVLEFMDEALIKDHPLNIFAVNLDLFSEDEDLLTYEFEDITIGHIFPVTEKYEALVQRTALRLIRNCKTEKKNPEAIMIDVMGILYQHFRSMNYFFNENDSNFQKVFYISARFPDELFDASLKFIEKDRNLESVETLFKTLYNQVCSSNPTEFAPMKYLLDTKFAKEKSLYFPYLGSSILSVVRQVYQAMENPKNPAEMRVYMAALSIVATADPYYNPKTKGEAFVAVHILFVYEVLKKIDHYFPEIAVSLFKREALSMLRDLEQVIKGQLMNFETPFIFYVNCINFGLVETVKFLANIDLKLSRDERFQLATIAMTTRQIQIVNFWFDKYSVNSFSPFQKIKMFETALIHCPFEEVEKLFGRLPDDYYFSLNDVTKEALEGRHFPTFDVLAGSCGDCCDVVISKDTRIKLIQYALESRLPDAKIREYISSFGVGIVLVGNKSANGKLLGAAAGNGFLSFIKEFNFCDAEPEAKFEAVEQAAKNKHEVTSMYLIDSFDAEMDFVHFASLAWLLSQNKSYESLKYLTAKRFGTEISAELKARILLTMIITFYNTKYEMKHLIRGTIIEFCRMMDWTRLLIEYSDKTLPMLDVEAMDWVDTRRYHQLMLNCLDNINNGITGLALDTEI